MKQILSLLRQTGPALILASVVLGPGSITLATLSGGLYRYRLLWVVVLSTALMVTYTLMSARIGLVTRRTLFEVTRARYGVWPAKLGGLLGFLSILAFQAGNSAAVGFSGEALFGFDSRFWSAAFLLPALGLFLLPNLYRKLELLVKVVVIIMVIAFAGTLCLVGIDPKSAAEGLIPTFPDRASIFLSLGMAATTFSIAAASYQNYLMREKRWGVEDLYTQGLDTFLGIGVLGAITILILLTSAGVIYESGQREFSARTMALQLEPLLGAMAFHLFGFGLFFAAFSSLVINPLIGATLLVDGFGTEPSMESRSVKLWAVTAMVMGTVVVLVFKGSPVELLRVAQALAIVAFPLLAFLVWSLAADRQTMGNLTIRPWVNVLAGVGYLMVLGIVFGFLRQIVS